jgi:hypothetical protein
VPQYGTRSFIGKSGIYEVEEWLATDSGELEQAVRESVLATSVEIVRLLNERWEP